MDSTLQVRLLGKISLRLGGQEIHDGSNRSRKMWLLLAYMICRRGQSISNEELSSLLRNGEANSSNTLNALKTMFHRVRVCLDQLGENAGHLYIIRQNGQYAWNTQLPMTLDIDSFDTLCQAGAAAGDEDEKLTAWLQALDLYRGDFLTRLSSELWVIPIAAYYHNLYVQTALSALALLQKRGRHQDIVDLCRQILLHEPYQEQLYRFIMQALLELGCHQEAAAVYEDMSKTLFSALGVMPSEELRALYRQATCAVHNRTIAPETLLDQLREPPGAGGALFCSYDSFLVICHAVARAVERNGDAVHFILFSVLGEDGGELAPRSLNRVMENLQPIICTSLRRGDVAARCSISQFILMLPQANYENSHMICERVMKAFARQYPHSPARLSAHVSSLEPNRPFCDSSGG